MAKNDSKLVTGAQRETKSPDDGSSKGSTSSETKPDAPAADTKAPPPIDGASDGSEGGPPAAPPPKEEPVRFPYQVAPGRSITSIRGVLGPGSEVRPEYLHGGQPSLDILVDRKIVLKREEAKAADKS